jgi:hypothetical protein
MQYQNPSSWLAAPNVTPASKRVNRTQFSEHQKAMGTLLELQSSILLGNLVSCARICHVFLHVKLVCCDWMHQLPWG